MKKYKQFFSWKDFNRQNIIKRPINEVTLLWASINSNNAASHQTNKHRRNPSQFFYSPKHLTVGELCPYYGTQVQSMGDTDSITYTIHITGFLGEVFESAAADK